MTLQRRNFTRRLAAVLVAALAAVTMMAIPPADAHQTWTKETVDVGFFYSTFGKNPGKVLLVGGSAEEFCDADPDAPFGATPSSATGEMRERADGSIVIRARSGKQPIYLYEMDAPGAPPWIEQVCAGYFAGNPAVDPLASGNGRLRVRDVIESPDRIEVFNRVDGRLKTPAGKRYVVTGKADFVVENGAPVGNPEDFVTFKLSRVGKCPVA